MHGLAGDQAPHESESLLNNLVTGMLNIQPQEFFSALPSAAAPAPDMDFGDA